MGAVLSSVLRQVSGPDSDQGHVLAHWCPGCKSRHLINIEKKNKQGEVWSWNGNAQHPSFNPSINIVGACHYLLRDGLLYFCSDSVHALAGQTVELPDMPERCL